VKTKIIQLVIAVLFVSIAAVGKANTYNITVCAGSSVTIGNTIPGGAWYLWSSGNTTTTITMAPTTSFTDTVTILNSSWFVIQVDIYNVTVNPLPNAAITGDYGYCQFGSAQISGQGGIAYHWSNGPNTQMITVTQAGTYTVTVTDSNNCSAIASRQMSQFPLPQVFTINTSTPYICPGSGGMIPVSGSQPNTQYELLLNGVNTGTSLIGTGNPLNFTNIMTPGSYTVRATSLVTLCQSMMSGVVNLINLAPAGNAGTITGMTSLCTSNSTNQTYSVAPISGATGYVWSLVNGTIVSGQGTTTVMVNWIGNGSISVYGQNYCGAGSATTMSVVIHPNPTVTITPNNPYFCVGDSVMLTVGGNANTYSWTGSNGTGTGNYYAASIAGQVTVVGTNQYNCPSQPVSVTVTSQPNPTFTLLSPTGPVCAGTDVQLSATASQANAYNWTGPNNFWSNMQNPTLFGVDGTDVGTYTVTATSQYGCTASATVNVVVNPTPVISVSAMTPLCAGDDIHLISAHNGTSLVWHGPNNYSSIQQNPTITNATTAMTGWYVATSYLGSCFAKDSVNVVVNPTPTVSATASSNTVCAGLPVTLTGNGASSYSWSTGSTINPTTVNPMQNTTYFVTGTNQYGCEGTASVTITINTNGLISEFNSVGYPTCPGSGDGWLNLHVMNGVYPYNYQWSNGQNGTSSLSNLTAGTYSVTITDANGCQGHNSVNLTDPDPILINYTVNGHSISLNITGGTMLPGDTWLVSYNPNPISQTYLNAIFDPGVTSVFVTATDGHTCQETITAYISPSGIDDNDGQNTPIYMDGGNGTIVIPKNLPIDHVNVYGFAGGSAYTGNQHVVSTNGWAPGLYIIQVTTTNGKIITQKVMK
jgi:hypothetical protein